MSSQKIQESTPTSPPEKNPTREEFGRMFMARFREVRATENLVFRLADFSVGVVQPDGTVDEARTTRLENTYREYLLVPPEDREEVLDKLARFSLLARNVMPADYNDAVENLMPAVRCRARFELDVLLSQIAGEAYDKVVAEPFAVHLGVATTYSMPDAIATTTAGNLAQWSVTAEQAKQAAVENLRRLPSPFTRVDGKRGIFQSNADDGYDSSRILLPELIEKLPVRGSHIAMVPAACYFYVAGSDDPKALKALVARAEAAIYYPQPLSGYAFRLVNGQWHPWLPAPQHYLYERFRALQLITAFSTYGFQRKLLHALELRKPDPESCFVAGFGLDARKAPVPERSATSWAQGVPTLLPHVDEIFFVRGTLETGLKPIGPVPWKRVIEVMGDRMEPLGLYPERYRVRTFPTDHELAAMTAT